MRAARQGRVARGGSTRSVLSVVRGRVDLNVLRLDRGENLDAQREDFVSSVLFEHVLVDREQKARITDRCSTAVVVHIGQNDDKYR